jgi:hypothetical protein
MLSNVRVVSTSLGCLKHNMDHFHSHCFEDGEWLSIRAQYFFLAILTDHHLQH